MQTLEGFESAELGVLMRAGEQDIMIYNYGKCVQVLMERASLTEDEAVEWMEYNIVCAYNGAGTPGFITVNP